MKNFIKYSEQALHICRDLEIKEKFDRVIISGVGINAIPGLAIRTFIPNGNIEISQDYCDIDNLNYRSLVFLVSESGEEEEVLSHYRMAVRNDAKLIIFNNRGKLKKLFEKNKAVINFNIKEEHDSISYIGFVIFSILSILRNSEVFSDVKNELGNVLELVKKANINVLGMHLSKRIGRHTPVIITTKNLEHIGYCWKILFNNHSRQGYMNILQLALYSDLLACSDENYYIFLRDEKDGRQVRADIESAKKKIKKSGCNMIEISLTGEFFLLRILSALLICNNCLTCLIDEQQQSLEEFNS